MFCANALCETEYFSFLYMSCPVTEIIGYVDHSQNRQEYLRRQEIRNFMNPTPREGNLVLKNVKFTYCFENLLIYSVTWFRQTNCIVMMTKEGSSKIINFMTPGAGVLLLGRYHMSYNENALFF